MVDCTFSHSHGSEAMRLTPESSIEEYGKFADCMVASAYEQQPSVLALLRTIRFHSIHIPRLILTYPRTNTGVALGSRMGSGGLRSKAPLKQLAPRLLSLVERRWVDAGEEDR